MAKIKVPPHLVDFYQRSPMCRRCIRFYNELYEQGKVKTPFPPTCKGDARLRHEVTAEMSDEEAGVRAMNNPVIWPQAEFMEPDDPSKPFEFRSYQKDMVSCTSKFKVFRMGRRTGKTRGIVTELIHQMFVKRTRVLILAPAETQLEEIYRLIDSYMHWSKMFGVAVTQRRSSPFILSMSNGSVAKGFVINSETGTSPNKIRGQPGDIIYVDEADYIPEDDFKPVFAILADKEETQMWMTSTPCGMKKRFYYMCFPGDTKVLDGTGQPINISDVQVGSSVLGIHGAQDIVSRVFEQPYKGEVLQVRVRGHNNMPWSTPEHPYWIRRGTSKMFLETSKLQAGDMVMVPKTLASSSTPFPIPVPKDPLTDRRMEIATAVGAPEEVAKNFNTTRQSVANLRKKYEKGGYLNLLDSRRRQAYRDACAWLFAAVEDTRARKDLIRFLGYYLAEGSVTHSGKGSKYVSGICLTFHSAETRYHKEVLDLGRRLFGVEGKIVLPSDKQQTAQILFLGSWIGLAMRHLCGSGSENKRLHPFFVGQYDSEWLETHAFGDGHARKDGGLEHTTISRVLADQIYHAYIRLGELCSFNKLSKGNRQDSYSIYRFAHQKSNDMKFIDGNLWLRVKEVASKQYDGLVYNLTTENTHTYLAEGIAVHNCTEKDRGWKEFYYPTMVSPVWTEKLEADLRAEYTETEYKHEILAEFGEVEGGVYPGRAIDVSLYDYDYQFDKPKGRFYYAMGVDWNDAPIGVHIIVVRYDWENDVYKVVDKAIENSVDFTQHKAIQLIEAMYRKWQPNWLWADAGHGKMQIESLRLHAMNSGNPKMIARIRGIHMNEREEIHDPLTKEIKKKQIKRLIVDLTLRKVEMERCVFPLKEDVKDGLVDQMRNFRILRYNQYGDPVYSQGYEHTLVAWQVAMYALISNYGRQNPNAHKNRSIQYTEIAPGKYIRKDEQPDFGSLNIAPEIMRLLQIEQQGKDSSSRDIKPTNPLSGRPGTVKMPARRAPGRRFSRSGPGRRSRF